MKNKVTTAIILTITFLLAGVAIFTAIRLYQLRNKSITPTAPESKPAAAEQTPSSSCKLSFTLGSTPTATATSTSTSTATATATGTSTATATSTSTSTATATSTASPTGTPTYCGASCGTSNSNCQSNSICYQGTCRNPSCVSESDCTCGTTSTPVATATQPSLPNSGTSWPTIIGAGLGILVVFGSLLLAL